MPGSFEEFYRQKKVLITGHSGFKGGWLSAWLQLLGANVVGIALQPDTHPNLFIAAQIPDRMTSVFGDVRDFSLVSAFFKEQAPEIVFHVAAQPLVRRSYREPVETYATNILGTVNVLEAVRQTPSVRCAVIVTSDKCYENRELSRGYTEEDALGGHDPYSSSKAAAELVTAAYRRSFFSDKSSACIASARAGNVIGGGDWAEDRLIPDIVRGICSRKPIVIRRPGSIRPWQHVLEPLRGYLLLARGLFEQGQSCAGAWNFGPNEDETLSVGEVAHRFISQWGDGQLEIETYPDGLHETQSLRLNSEKAAKHLGWKPVLSLNNALEWSMEWYRTYYQDPKSGRSVTDAQIERYTKAAIL